MSESALNKWLNYTGVFAGLIKRTGSVLISVLLLVVLMSSAAYMIDIKTATTVLFTMEPAWLCAAFLLTTLTFLVNSYRFAVIARWMLPQNTSYAVSVKITWLGGFLALSTPFAVLGDVARAGLMKMVMRVPVRRCIEIILFDRGFGLLTLLLFLLLTSLGCARFIQQQYWLLLAQVILPAAAVFGLVIVLVGSSFVRWPDNRLSGYVKFLLDDLSSMLKKPNNLLLQMFITLLNIVIYVASFIALSYAMHFSFDIVMLLLFCPLILIINNMPFFYMGWGGREAVLLMLVPIIAPTASNEVILAASMGCGAVFMLVSLMGGVYLLNPNTIRNRSHGEA